MSVELIDLHPAPADLHRLVEAGLAQQPKQLPAWLLYDAEGSRLFAEICDQPEYSLTRTEITLLEQRATEIASAVGEGVVVEFGIGNARKVDPLLTALRPPAFIALDISRTALEDSLSALAEGHRDIPMLGICCDHSTLDALPHHPRLQGERRIGFFPGSSLGNFQPQDAVSVLERFRRLLAGGPLLLGLDQPRDPSLLEAAYNDAAGVSAAFARNLLHRLNRELNGNARPEQFHYRARWQPQQQRIEMALVSRCEQTVQLAQQSWAFAEGEALITEHSVKYSPEAAAELASRAGWRIRQRWHDPNDTLSLHWLEPAD
jgi:L-histidine N-alpha-methyltransferase